MLNKYHRVNFLIGTVILASCSSHYKVTKIPENVPRFLKGGGAYYSLPKTQIVVQVPVTQIEIKPGKLSFKYKQNVAKCKARQSLLAPPDGDFTPGYKLAPGNISISSIAVPDEEHRYRLEVDPKAFSSFSHTLATSKSGLLTSSSTSVKDGATQAVLTSASLIAELSSISQGFAAAAAGAAASGGQCDEMLAADAVLNTHKSSIDKLEKIREGLLFSSGLVSKSDTLKLSLAHIDKAIASLKKKHKKALEDTNPKNKKTMHFALIATVEPGEFATLSS
ncbi:DUF4831 family protein [Teredinibacter purpureus]|uniref:DUF4831 family protein n=1 Tax=Teredinibacter purpureus TaxID=2731756 RepID=UPI0005F7F9B7|nr:DUF4831 family protein [Teredinibacter purpureus]